MVQPSGLCSVGLLLCSRQLCEWCLNGPPNTLQSSAFNSLSYSRLARRIVETGADWTDRGMAGDGRTNERSYGT